MTEIDKELLDCALEVVKEAEIAYLKRNALGIPLAERTLRYFAREIIQQSKLGDSIWLNKKLRRANRRLRYRTRKDLLPKEINSVRSQS